MAQEGNTTTTTPREVVISLIMLIIMLINLKLAEKFQPRGLITPYLDKFDKHKQDRETQLAS